MATQTEITRAETFAEMIAHGVAERVAILATNSLMTFGNAPAFGLGAMDDRLLASQARAAIEAHLERALIGKAA